MAKDWTMVWAIFGFSTSYIEQGAEKKDNYYIDRERKYTINPGYIKRVSSDFPQLVPMWLCEQFMSGGMVRIIKDIRDFIKGNPEFDDEKECGEIWRMQFFSHPSVDGPKAMKPYPPKAILNEVNRIKGILGQQEKAKPVKKVTTKKTTAKTKSVKQKKD